MLSNFDFVWGKSFNIRVNIIMDNFFKKRNLELELNYLS